MKVYKILTRTLKREDECNVNAHVRYVISMCILVSSCSVS